MAVKAQSEPFDLQRSLLVGYATSNRINAYLINNIADEAWTLKGPGGKGRDIAAIVAHMHNVRLLWLKSVGIPESETPAKLDGGDVSRNGAIAALDASCTVLTRVLENAFASDGRIKGFRPDAGSFLAYLLSHDAHHRGQITMLARQIGHPISQSAMFGMWEWGTR